MMGLDERGLHLAIGLDDLELHLLTGLDELELESTDTLRLFLDDSSSLATFRFFPDDSWGAADRGTALESSSAKGDLHLGSVLESVPGLEHAGSSVPATGLSVSIPSLLKTRNESNLGQLSLT